MSVVLVMGLFPRSRAIPLRGDNMKFLKRIFINFFGSKKEESKPVIIPREVTPYDLRFESALQKKEVGA